MNSFADANLESASQIYAVSNTPVYLIRRLYEDPVVSGIARSFSGEQILQEFNHAVERDPENLLDYVRPYAYLVALSKLPTIDYLRAADMSRARQWRWLFYMHKVLLETYSPLSITTIEGSKASLSNYSSLTRSHSTTSTIVLGG